MQAYPHTPSPTRTLRGFAVRPLTDVIGFYPRVPSLPRLCTQSLIKRLLKTCYQQCPRTHSFRRWCRCSVVAVRWTVWSDRFPQIFYASAWTSNRSLLQGAVSASTQTFLSGRPFPDKVIMLFITPSDPEHLLVSHWTSTPVVVAAKTLTWLDHGCSMMASLFMWPRNRLKFILIQLPYLPTRPGAVSMCLHFSKIFTGYESWGESSSDSHFLSTSTVVHRYCNSM